MERITDDMQSALKKIADDLNLLLVSSRRFFSASSSGWQSEKKIHPLTLNALIRHGLVQKKTIEVYELTPTGQDAMQWGRFPKEGGIDAEVLAMWCDSDKQGK